MKMDFSQKQKLLSAGEKQVKFVNNNKWFWLRRRKTFHLRHNPWVRVKYVVGRSSFFDGMRDGV